MAGEQHDRSASGDGERERSPFAFEEDVITDTAAQRDEISEAQASGEAAAHLSATHTLGLLYEPGYGYAGPPSLGGTSPGRTRDAT